MVPGCLCAGHPAGDWGNMGTGGGGQDPDEPRSSFSPLHLSLSLISYSFALLLSPPSSSSLPSLNGGSSLVIHWSPLSVPRQPPSPASLLTTTHNHSIKAPRGPAAWLMFIKESIVVANPSHHVCCHHCKSLIVLYRCSQVLFLLHLKQSSIIKDSARCVRQPWQV